MPNQPIRWENVPAPEPGDRALHYSGELDARTVVRVEGVDVWLQGIVGEIGPVPVWNYTYRRQVKP